MKDMVLEQRLRHCQQLIEAWQRFHQYLMACIKGQEFNAQAENDFLKVKSQIAILHDSFLASVPKGSRETAATSQSVISLVEKCILLRQVKRFNVAELKRMEMEWHEAYLLINDTIGVLQEEVSKLAGESEFGHNMTALQKKLKAYAGGAAANKGMQVGVVVVALLVGLILLPVLGVFSYDVLDTKGATKKPYRAVRKVLRMTVTKDLKFLDLEEYNYNGRNNIENFPSKDDENLKKLIEGQLKNLVQSSGVPLEGVDTATQMYESLNDAYSLIATPGAPAKNGKAQVVVFRAKFKAATDASDAKTKITESLSKVPSISKMTAVGCHSNVLYIALTPTSEEAIKDVKANLENNGKAPAPKK
ncbi:MAG TPA: hypothetical protein PLA90_05675 [Candidatus Sumerlaeota bacterium]|nr:hypothetical protein [Candidatus Sumerlaeota bacterium]HPS01013.1 hypothetical protein [Candidatus Sumerlaeota bacterium]